MRATEAQTLGETNSGVVNAQARLAAAKATLAQAKADLARIQSDSERMIALAKAGVESDQDQVRAEAATECATGRGARARRRMWTRRRPT